LNDIRWVVRRGAPVPVKVILEVHYLSDDQIKTGCELCIQAGATLLRLRPAGRPRGDFGTVKLITRFVSGAIKVKASGGIRDLETVVKMCRMGGKRFESTPVETVSILASCQSAHKNGKVGISQDFNAANFTGF